MIEVKTEFSFQSFFLGGGGHPGHLEVKLESSVTGPPIYNVIILDNLIFQLKRKYVGEHICVFFSVFKHLLRINTFWILVTSALVLL